jgi:hypothetical protein
MKKILNSNNYLHRQVKKNKGRIGLQKGIPPDPSNLLDGGGNPHENLAPPATEGKLKQYNILQLIIMENQNKWHG